MLIAVHPVRSPKSLAEAKSRECGRKEEGILACEALLHCYHLLAVPRWASVNLGLLLCSTCAGMHRSLGVHISRVRSTDLDTWRADELKLVESIGNKVGNAYWEANLPKNFTRPKQGETSRLEHFIRQKYEHRAFSSREHNPYTDAEQAPRASNAAETTKASTNEPFPKPNAPTKQAPVTMETADLLFDSQPANEDWAAFPEKSGDYTSWQGFDENDDFADFHSSFGGTGSSNNKDQIMSLFDHNAADMQTLGQGPSPMSPQAPPRGPAPHGTGIGVSAPQAPYPPPASPPGAFTGFQQRPPPPSAQPPPPPAGAPSPGAFPDSVGPTTGWDGDRAQAHKGQGQPHPLPGYALSLSRGSPQVRACARSSLFILISFVSKKVTIPSVFFLSAASIENAEPWSVKQGEVWNGQDGH